MIKKILKKSFPVIFSAVTFIGCESNYLINKIALGKDFLENATGQFAEDVKPKYDDSMLKKWYKVKDEKIMAERILGLNDYKNNDIIIPYIGEKWTRTSYEPLIKDLFEEYIGFNNSWPEQKKISHKKHYNQYLESFLKRIGEDADINKDNIITKDELKYLKQFKSYMKQSL